MQIHPDDSPCEYSPSAFLEIPTRGGILMTATLSSPSSSSLVPSTPGLFCPEQEHNFWDSVADWPGELEKQEEGKAWTSWLHAWHAG